jgi:hypothetical protein
MIAQIRMLMWMLTRIIGDLRRVTSRRRRLDVDMGVMEVDERFSSAGLCGLRIGMEIVSLALYLITVYSWILA